MKGQSARPDRLLSVSRGRLPMRRGISLVETLVALAILSVATSLLISFAAQSVKASFNAQRRAATMVMAADRIEQIVLHRDNLAALKELWREDFKGEEMGAWVFGGVAGGSEAESYEWTASIKDVKGRPGLKHVAVAVPCSRVVGGQPRGRFQQKYETYLAVPSESQ